MDFAIETDCLEFEAECNSQEDVHENEAHDRFQPIEVLLSRFDRKADATMSDV